MKKMLSRLPENKSFKAMASALGATALLACAANAVAGDILFVSDSATDSSNIPDVLSGGSPEVAHPSITGAFFRPAATSTDHDVTILRDDYTVTGGTFGLAEGTNPALAGLVTDVTLADYCSVFWSASGPHEPDAFAGGLGADGGIHNDAAVFTSLEAYVAAGGFVLVTGHDATADPMDTSMEVFVGGPGTIAAQQLRTIPSSFAVNMEPNALTTGETTIGGSAAGAVFAGGVNVLDGAQDLDYLAGWDVAQTAAVVVEPLVPGAAMWTIRTPSGVANQSNFVNTGHIAYVASGIFLFEDLPFNPGTFLSDGEDDSWIHDSTYKAALRNFAVNSCISLPFDATKTPVANPQSVSTPLDTPIAITLTGSDPNGDTITFMIDTSPSSGILSGTEPNVTYTPNSGFSGNDSFTFVVSDASRTSDPATVQIEVLPNTAPDAVDDAYSTNEDTPLSVAAPGVMANDSDVDGDTLTVTGNTNPSNGSIGINTDGSFTYTPDPDFNGSDSFTYDVSDGNGGTDTATVNITVNPVNDAPDAVDDAYVTNEDTVLIVATPGVLANDSDVDGDSLTVSGNTNPSNGSVGVNADGSFTYTPDPDFNGIDSFTYDVSDGDGGTDTATVTITISPVNDAPIANGDSATTDEDVPVTIDVLANDTDVDGDALTVTAASNPPNGTAMVNPDNTVTYTPDPDFNGSDSFTYDVSDGNGGTDTATVNITVNPVNDAPDAVDDAYVTNEDTVLIVATPGVLANDSDVDGDSLTVSGNTNPSNGSVGVNADGSFTYTPDPDFNGIDSFTYDVSDGNGGTDTATVTITINPVNDAPVANDDIYAGTEDVALPVSAPGVLSNDSDVDGDTLTALVGTGPANGGLLFNSNGSFTYTPNPHYCGSDSFTYNASDGSLPSNTATVTLNIACINDAPVAEDDSYSTNEDTTLNVAAPGVLANDSDIDGDALTAIVVSGPSDGLLTLNGDGSFGYSPNTNYFGSDSFTYKANDGLADSNVATVSITINAVNDAPVIQQVSPASQTVDYSDNITDVTITATDVDSPVLTLTDSGPPASLSISGSCVPDNTVPAGTGGNCSWTLSGVVNVSQSMHTVGFTVTDDGGLNDSASTDITIEAEDATATLDENNPVALEVASEGGDSGPFNLTVVTRETLPDNAHAGPAAAGDINNAVVTIVLDPVGPGPSIPGTCSTTPMGTTGYDQYLETVCMFDNVPVNTYTTVASVNVAGYYTGGDEDVLTIFDPSLGFTTGGGWFYWPDTDDRTNFGYTMKYGKNGRNVKGNLVLIRRTDTGKYRIKSNALEGLAIGEGGMPSDPFGWASFSGKATYIEPGWLDAVGNHEFTVYVEDLGEPGAGADRFWLEVRDKDRNVVPDLSMDEPADSNAETISGGNIVVPHTNGGNGNGNGNGNKN